MDPADVTDRTDFRGPDAPRAFPDLGKWDACDYRIYLLRCRSQILGGPFTLYAGCEHRSDLVKRLRRHFNGTGADYTQEYPPINVQLVLPCPTKAAEAYLFYALTESRPLAAVTSGRLGGWTQTRPKPSETCKLMLQDAWRMLKGACLCCGSQDGHVAKRCPNKAKIATAPLTCGHCQATIRVTALGHVTTAPPYSATAGAPGTAASTSGPGKRKADEMLLAIPQPKRRAAAAAPPPAPSTMAAAPVAFPQVSVVDHRYTTLEWFLGRGSTPKERREALHHCGGHSVELHGGDHTTLLKSGWAKSPPLRCKELFPDRKNFPVSDAKDTSCRALKHPHGFVKARSQAEPKSLKSILLRVDDLRQCAVTCCWRGF
jgi:predicted GIY-YIG superfamily endonuclease